MALRPAFDLLGPVPVTFVLFVSLVRVRDLDTGRGPDLQGQFAKGDC